LKIEIKHFCLEYDWVESESVGFFTFLFL
jgi:hypothetical protein